MTLRAVQYYYFSTNIDCDFTGIISREHRGPSTALGMIAYRNKSNEKLGPLIWCLKPRIKIKFWWYI